MRATLPQPNVTSRIHRLAGALALALMMFLTTAVPAVAEEVSDVYINGYKLGFFERIALEDYIDQNIPDGYYWFELNTGMWGPIGGTALGHIEVPEDYREYVESRIKTTPDQAAQARVSATAKDCGTRCLFW